MASVGFVGTASRDVVLHLPRFLSGSDKVTANTRSVRVGGPAVNAAITCARLGGPASLVTSCDTPESLAAEPRLEVVGVAGFASRESTVLVDPTGHRQIISTPPVEIPERVPGVAGDIVLAASSLNFSLACLEARSERPATLVVDSGSAGPTALNHPLLERADIVVAGDEGFEDDATRLGFLTTLSDRGILGYCTRGDRPILTLQDGSAEEIPVPRVAAVDTLAAGDVLHGALAYYLAAGKNPRAAIESAAGVASYSTTVHGLPWTFPVSD